jgi:hypothetical protein
MWFVCVLLDMWFVCVLFDTWFVLLCTRFYVFRIYLATLLDVSFFIYKCGL